MLNSLTVVPIWNSIPYHVVIASKLSRFMRHSENYNFTATSAALQLLLNAPRFEYLMSAFPHPSTPIDLCYTLFFCLAWLRSLLMVVHVFFVSLLIYFVGHVFHAFFIVKKMFFVVSETHSSALLHYSLPIYFQTAAQLKFPKRFCIQLESIGKDCFHCLDIPNG